MKKQQIGAPVNILAFLMLIAGCSLANAQVTGSISGKVEDPTGSGVDGAAITVKSLETGAVRIATTDQAGNFIVLLLPLGAQEVKAEKKGFKSALRTGIKLELGEEAVVNLRLDVGELAQQVTIS